MILFWNQKEVYVGSAMKDFNRVRNTLESNNIKYTVTFMDVGNNKPHSRLLHVHYCLTTLATVCGRSGRNDPQRRT